MSVGGVPDTLNDRHILAAHMVVLGKSAREIADKLDYTLNRVYLIKRSPLFQAKVAQIRAEVEERLFEQAVDMYAAFDAEAPFAFQTLREIHRDRSKNDSVRRQAALDILERAPSVPKKKQEKAPQSSLNIQNIHISEKQKQNMADAMRAIGAHDVVEKFPPEWRPKDMPELMEAKRRGG